ncbi:MAG: GAF domain-containing protein [Deltaproteobacteria bacterium]|nr:GAF domain-containing protein [Deltaproteobacteria bacterium]MCW5808415.1 GAF domain-containing protein [Deltaproteobacteria bacterium]
MIDLASLDRCFSGIIPGVIATCDRDGTPNVSYLSYVHLIDERHVGLSCQFFNKTRQNLDEHPIATLEAYDALTFQSYRLRLRFVRSETEGPLFDAMALRIFALATHIGMAGIFKLRSADVCEVLSVERREGFLEPDARGAPQVVTDGPLTELRGLQIVSERVSRARDLDALLSGVLAALDEVFGFTHGMILMPCEEADALVTVASHGYGDEAIGAEVEVGEGLIGLVAQTRTLVRIASVSSELRYGRAIRAQYGDSPRLRAEIPLPRLANAESQMAIPLLVQDRLVGVLALECTTSLTFAQWHEGFLQVLANQIASGIDRMDERDDGDAEPGEPATAHTPEPRKLGFCYYRNDDCVFVDGEYLIRNVPGKILWKILRAYEREGRTEFSNRELRLDPSLGLPAFKDNLESRLILLRKRLEQKCADIRLVPTRRGRFALEVACGFELVERETA